MSDPPAGREVGPHPSGVSAPSSTAAEPALSGALGTFSPSEVLQLLQLAQATGRLELARPDARAAPALETVDVFFEDGRPVFARTSGVAVRTGEILVHRGHASREAVEAALEIQRREPGRRIGRVLRDAGAVPFEPVARAVHEGLRRILYGVLLWREGRFHFFAGERARDNDLPLDLDLDRLILEGLRLADQARSGA
ncbi:MAG TPA: DUF4388 domain-containing protein [Terriglobales bacterium]|nr:DUF4388 domain-containing protein [Terriglobales bacterium]